MNLFVLAVAMKLTFTAPAPDTSAVTRYEAIRFNAMTAPTSAILYSNPVTFAVLQPQPPGSTVTCYVYITADPDNALGWRRGGTTIVMRACSGDSCAEWSNAVILATAMPVDTNVTSNGRDWQRTVGGIARFTRALGDTALSVLGIPGPLVVQEQVQEAMRERLCASFGFWCLRGARMPCP